MSAAPILGFICPQCHHGMRSVCDACEEREQIEAGEQASFEQSAQQQAYNTRLAEMRTIPGYQALEDDLEAHLYTLATVLVEADADEDGPTGYFHATLGNVPWLHCNSGAGAPRGCGGGAAPRDHQGPARRRRWARRAPDGRPRRWRPRHDLRRARGHADRLAVAGQIERSQAVHALLVRLGKGAS